MKKLTLIILTLTSFTAFSQNITLDIRSYASSGNDLPFWFTANQRGVFTQENSTYQLGQLEINRDLSPNNNKTWDFTYGTNLVYGLAKSSQTQINQYFAGVRFKKLVFTAGAQSDPVYYGGLSSTNGNMFASNNARPLPGVKIASHGWIAAPILKKHLSFRFAYQEMWLDNDRVVQNAHLHHKNLHFKYQNNDWSITAGVEHYSFWGGTHPTMGQLPNGVEDYIRGVTGMAGGAAAPGIDQANVAGNQLGTYIVQFAKKYSNSSIRLYWNHIFEDRSGMEMENWRDGLWGFHCKSKKSNQFITEVLYEYMYTKHQSGKKHLIYNPTLGKYSGRGNDDYFNHEVYVSGYIANKKIIGSPFFIPDNIKNSSTLNFSNTRMWMHHIATKGYIADKIQWCGMLSYTGNFGTYKNPYKNTINQLSYMIKSIYYNTKLPFKIITSIAGDYFKRESINNCFAINIGITKQW